MSSRKPTQKDVARLAGVSQPLVSLVLSEAAAPVAKEARERVLEAARQLGYPLLRGRRKNSRRSRRLLAYIRPSVERLNQDDHRIFDSYDHFYDQIQNLLVEQAYAAECEMIVRPYTRPVEVTHWLIEWGVEGVFWHSNDETLAQWISERYPTVQINRHLKIQADSVLSNQEEIVLQAIHHLRQQGHQRIALLSMDRTDTAVRERNRTYLAAMREQGLPCYDALLREPDLDKIAAYLGTRPTDGPTALILGDFHALQMQARLHRAGLSLPEEMSMVGIDNISAAEFANPRLTSVDLQLREVINAAMSVMTSRLGNAPGATRKIEVSPRLVVRDSVFRREGKPAPLP
jgi:LacI family transcriptional regulator